MDVVTVKDGENGDSPVRGAPKPEEVREQLKIVLASSAFNASKRSQQFLQYVCEKSLSGEAGTLKERTVAVEVFGRRPDSELGENTIVRVGAREVRKRLTQFYASPEAVYATVRIDLPSGGYVPEFRYAESFTKTEPKADPLEAPSVSEPTQRTHRSLLLVAVLLAALAIAVLPQLGRQPHPDVVDRFWEPALSSADSILVAVANPVVYRPSIPALRLAEESLPASPIKLESALRFAPIDTDKSKMVAVQNQYVTFGDMVATHQIATMLTAKGKNVRLRRASSIFFNDMRKAPVVLVGAVTNQWTMAFQTGWRYQFRYNPGSSTVLWDTFDKPDGKRPQRQWSVTDNSDDAPQEDFVLVCRLKDPVTAGFLVVLAGARQWGTEAAGRLVSEAGQLAAISRNLPSGWADKNLQIVLRVRIIGNAPGQPVLAAAHIW